MSVALQEKKKKEGEEEVVMSPSQAARIPDNGKCGDVLRGMAW